MPLIMAPTRVSLRTPPSPPLFVGATCYIPDPITDVENLPNLDICISNSDVTQTVLLLNGVRISPAE